MGFFSGYEVSGRQVTVGAKNQYPLSASVLQSPISLPGPIWSGPSAQQIPQGLTDSIFGFVSVANPPVVFTIDPIRSTVQEITLNTGGITFDHNTGIFTASLTASLTFYPNIVILATDALGKNAPSSPFTLTVIPQASWNQSLFNALIRSDIPTGSPGSNLPILRFTRGVPQFLSLTTLLATGINPATTIFINHDVREELALNGITYGQVGGQWGFSYDGTLSLGMVTKFMAYASSNGECPPFPDIMPYQVLRPFSGLVSGPQYLGTQYGNGGVDGGFGTVSDFTISSSFLNTAQPLRYENNWGDWYGQGYTKQGTTPWHTLGTIASGFSGPITVDVTALVQAWDKGYIPNLGFYLQATGGVGRIVNFSRWNSGNGSVLTITWAEGGSTAFNASMETPLNSSFSAGTLYPQANTTFPCLGVPGSGSFSAPIVFFDPTQWASLGKTVASATLTMQVHDIQSGPDTVNIYAVRWSGQDTVLAPDDGACSPFVNDANLESLGTNVVMSVQRWTSPGVYGKDTVNYLTTNPDSAGWRSADTTLPATDTNDPALAVRAVIGTSDPLVPGYVPPHGQNCYRYQVPGGQTNHGGYILYFQPYALGPRGRDPDGVTDIKEMWFSCIVEFDPILGFDPTLIGGHAGFPGLTGEWDGQGAVAGTDARTGFAWASPVENTLGDGQRFDWQANTCADEEVNIATIGAQPLAANTANKTIALNGGGTKAGYRCIRGYSYSASQPSGIAAGTLTVTALAGATSVTVSTPSFWTVSPGAQILVRLDNGTLWFGTSSGAPTGSVVPLVSPIPSQASSGNIVRYKGSNSRVYQQTVFWDGGDSATFFDGGQVTGAGPRAAAFMRMGWPNQVDMYCRINTRQADGITPNADGEQRVYINRVLALKRTNWVIVDGDARKGIGRMYIELFAPGTGGGGGNTMYNQTIRIGQCVALKGNNDPGARYFTQWP